MAMVLTTAGKKRRVLRSSRPCNHDFWHTELLFASLIGSNHHRLKGQSGWAFLRLISWSVRESSSMRSSDNWLPCCWTVWPHHRFSAQRFSGWRYWSGSGSNWLSWSTPDSSVIPDWRISAVVRRWCSSVYLLCLVITTPAFQPSVTELFRSPLTSRGLWNTLPQNVPSAPSLTVLEETSEDASLQLFLYPFSRSACAVALSFRTL